jgi:hypothetical protein
MWQSVSTVALIPSHFRRWVALCLSGLLGLSVLSWPADSVLLWPAFALLLPSFYLVAQWSQVAFPLFFTLGIRGDLRWHHDLMPAGQLVDGSIICRFGVWLCWLDVQGKRRHCWLFCDQVSAADFRLLGRHCQQLRWQHGH